METIKSFLKQADEIKLNVIKQLELFIENPNEFSFVNDKYTIKFYDKNILEKYKILYDDDVLMLETFQMRIFMDVIINDLFNQIKENYEIKLNRESNEEELDLIPIIKDVNFEENKPKND